MTLITTFGGLADEKVLQHIELNFDFAVDLLKLFSWDLKMNAKPKFRLKNMLYQLI